MAQMKTVTINGVTYKIEDPDALSGTDTTLSEANKAADAAAVGAALAGKAPAKKRISGILDTAGWYRIGVLAKYTGYRLTLSSLFQNNGDFTALIDITASYSRPVLNKAALSKSMDILVVDQVRLVSTSDYNRYYVDFHYTESLANEIYALIDGAAGTFEQYSTFEVIMDANIGGTVSATLAL